MQDVLSWIDREVERLDRVIEGIETEDSGQNQVPEVVKAALGFFDYGMP